jgi:hypothetical protein
MQQYTIQYNTIITTTLTNKYQIWDRFQLTIKSQYSTIENHKKYSTISQAQHICYNSEETLTNQPLKQ